MVKPLPRFLLAFAALLLAIGALMHASAFKEILSFLANSNLRPFAANGLKVLWLGDSATNLILAGVFGLIAARPFATTGGVIVLLSFDTRDDRGFNLRVHR